MVRLCNWVGEVVLSVPAIRRLSNAGFHVHLYGKGWAPSLLEGLDLPVSVRKPGVLSARSQLRSLRERLALEHPGSPPRALLFTRSFSSALETWAAGLTPVGYAYDGRSPLLTEAYPRPSGLHAGAEYWQVVNEFLREDLPFPEQIDLKPSVQQIDRAHALLSQAGLSAHRYVLLCPFSGSDDREDRKIWPGFPELSKRLQAAGLSTVVCPGPGEQAIVQDRTPGSVSLPDVDLGVYGALLALSGAVVSNDTGPGHLAAAVGARLVSVYGPHSIAAWTPVGPNVTLFHGQDWPALDAVFGAVRDALDQPASSP